MENLAWDIYLGGKFTIYVIENHTNQPKALSSSILILRISRAHCALS